MAVDLLLNLELASIEGWGCCGTTQYFYYLSLLKILICVVNFDTVLNENITFKVH